MSTKILTAETFCRMVRGGAAELDRNRKEINDLNVFPIPDGDTGDNMYMTIAAGAGAAESDRLSEAAAAVSKGMLFGARGNSGVILSRIFAGISKGFEGFDTATPDTFISALESGVKESYGAVSNAVEGTILTVFRESVEKAAAIHPFSIEKCFEVMIPEMEASLKRTPDLLLVLKEAGVVDSGGAGILCIFRGMAAAVGEDAVIPDGISAPGQPKAAVNLDAFGPDSELEFGYCTEFLLRLQNSKVDVANFDESELISWLNGAGESVVAFKDGSIVKVHVHTKTPGDILNHCQQYGEYLTVKVENMTLQHHETEIKNNFAVGRKAYGIVTVASGNGLVASLREAGADCVIEGGQTMNPSSEDFIKAFDTVGAETIFVFPNNSNIILAANQAAELYKGAEIIVIPTKTVGEGYVAIASADFSSKDTSSIRDSILETISGVVTGLVSKAIRSSKMDGISVREGEFIGIGGGRILTSSASEAGCATETCDKLDAGSHDVAIVFTGKDAGEPDAVAAALQKKWPATEFIINDGGQPVYEYIIVLC